MDNGFLWVFWDKLRLGQGRLSELKLPSIGIIDEYLTATELNYTEKLHYEEWIWKTWENFNQLSSMISENVHNAQQVPDEHNNLTSNTRKEKGFRPKLQEISSAMNFPLHELVNLNCTLTETLTFKVIWRSNSFWLQN